jgi:hypothetical protein
MSTLAITAAHFVAIPVRYAVGRWYNIPTNTLLAFNAADVGLHILIRQIEEYAAAQETWKKSPIPLRAAYILTRRVIICLAGVYAASRLAEPIPLQAAALTNLAAGLAVAVAIVSVWWAKEKDE